MLESFNYVLNITSSTGVQRKHNRHPRGRARLPADDSKVGTNALAPSAADTAIGCGANSGTNASTILTDFAARTPPPSVAATTSASAREALVTSASAALWASPATSGVALNKMLVISPAPLATAPSRKKPPRSTGRSWSRCSLLWCWGRL